MVDEYGVAALDGAEMLPRDGVLDAVPSRSSRSNE